MRSAMLHSQYVKQEYTATAKKSWSAFCSTLASYDSCCQWNGRWVLTTDFDGRAVFNSWWHHTVWRRSCSVDNSYTLKPSRTGGRINIWTYFYLKQNISLGDQNAATESAMPTS